MKKYLFYFLIAFVFFSSNTNAQEKKLKISGKVLKAETNEPIENVKVKLKGTDFGTVTNQNGEYFLFISDSMQSIEFDNFNGLKIKTVQMISNSEFNIILRDYDNEDDLFELSLEELMQINVVSASNTTEKLSEVPATMIVITAEDILQRGYLHLDEIFNDLPGMQVSISHGSSNFANYWRGYRSSYSLPFLFMVDGLLVNDIYYNNSMFINSMPISNVKSIEVVYGPVSSIYGANAFMGVVNVITKKNLEENGVSVTANVTNNLGNSFISDFHTLIKKDKFRLSISGKIQSYNLSDFIDTDNYEYTKEKHLLDRNLWGGIVDMAEYDYNADSPIQNKGFSSSLFYGDTELGVKFNKVEKGWGYEYPTDKTQCNSVYISDDLNIYFKYNQKFNDFFSGRFKMVYRKNLNYNNDFLETYNIINDTDNDMIFSERDTIFAGDTARLIKHSTWSDYSISYLTQEDFDIKLSDNLQVNTGFKYEIKKFSNQLANYGSQFFPSSLIDPKDPNFIAEPSNMYDLINYTYTQKEFGGYAQVKFKFLEHHILNLGTRLDDNSAYGTNQTFRGVYIANFNKITGKILYGQAFRTPTPRNLYGSWYGQGSSLHLKPEESETLEFSFNYLNNNFSTTLSAYTIKNKNTILNFVNRAENAGEQKITGLDIHLQKEFEEIMILKKIKMWAYYSIILNEEKKIFDDNANEIGTDIIGDLSHNNLYFGLSNIINEHFSAHIIGKYIGKRKTVATNPIDEIDAYFNTDINFLVRDVLVEGLYLGFKIYNVLDTKYFHPGIKTADAGNERAYWSENGVWHGSKGWYNSKIPQPHRYFMISLIFKL